MAEEEDRYTGNPILDLDRRFVEFEQRLVNGDIPIPLPDLGEDNTSSNAGTGLGLAKPKQGVDLPFKTFVEGSFIKLENLGNEIKISVEGVPGVENLTFSELSDVDMDGVSDGEIPAWNNAASEYQPFEIGNHTNVADNTSARHGHTNKTTLDKLDEPAPPNDKDHLAWVQTNGKYEPKPLDAVEIKTKYESNADTNALTNSLVSDINNNTIASHAAITPKIEIVTVDAGLISSRVIALSFTPIVDSQLIVHNQFLLIKDFGYSISGANVTLDAVLNLVVGDKIMIVYWKI